jgi:hypothetical protein
MFLEPAPQSGEKDTLWQKILAIATYLLFWILLSAIGLWLMFELRSLLVELMILGQFNPWAVRGVDRWAIFVLGLIWFISLMLIEHYLRVSVDKKRLWRTIFRVAAMEAILVAIIFGARFVIDL